MRACVRVRACVRTCVCVSVCVVQRSELHFTCKMGVTQAPFISNINSNSRSSSSLVIAVVVVVVAAAAATAVAEVVLVVVMVLVVETSHCHIAPSLTNSANVFPTYRYPLPDLLTLFPRTTFSLFGYSHQHTAYPSSLNPTLCHQRQARFDWNMWDSGTRRLN